MVSLILLARAVCWVCVCVQNDGMGNILLAIPVVPVISIKILGHNKYSSNTTTFRKNGGWVWGGGFAPCPAKTSSKQLTIPEHTCYFESIRNIRVIRQIFKNKLGWGLGKKAIPERTFYI